MNESSGPLIEATDSLILPLNVLLPLLSNFSSTFIYSQHLLVTIQRASKLFLHHVSIRFRCPGFQIINSEESPKALKHSTMADENVTIAQRLEATETISCPPTAVNFAGLPAEIRLRVYRYLLVAPDSIGLVLCRHCKIKRSHHHCSIPVGVLQVSKLLYAEALPVLYCENTFEFTPKRYFNADFERELSSMLQQLGTNACNCIRKVEFSQCEFRHDEWKAFNLPIPGALKHVRELTVNIYWQTDDLRQFQFICTTVGAFTLKQKTRPRTLVVIVDIDEGYCLAPREWNSTRNSEPCKCRETWVPRDPRRTRSAVSSSLAGLDLPELQTLNLQAVFCPTEVESLGLIYLMAPSLSSDWRFRGQGERPEEALIQRSFYARREAYVWEPTFTKIPAEDEVITMLHLCGTEVEMGK